MKRITAHDKEEFLREQDLDLVYRAFEDPVPYAKEMLIMKARRKLGYSGKTTNTDIFIALWIAWKKMQR